MRSEVCCAMRASGAVVASIFSGATAHQSKSVFWACQARSQQLVTRLASARRVGRQV